MFLFMNRPASSQTTGQPRCEAEPDLPSDCQVDPYAPLTLVAALLSASLNFCVFVQRRQS